MNQPLKQSYRGVYCQCCRQPIPLPAIVIHIESERNGLNGQQQRGGGAFTFRCRACQKEMPYRTSEFVNIEGTPRPRFSNRRASKLLKQQDSLSRVANA